MNNHITPIQLSTIENNYLVKDMNYDFYYRRIFDPEQQSKKFFNLFFKEQGQPAWNVCNGVLTDDFTVVKTEDVIRQISSDLNSEIVKEKHYRHTTFVKSTFVLKEYDLDITEDSLANKIIFKLVTGIDANINIYTKSGIAFSVINGFSGNYALQLNYYFLKNFRAGDKIYALSNMFILDEYTTKLIHNTKFSVSYAEVTSVKQNIERKIQEFKNEQVDQEFIDAFLESFPKKFGKQFMSYFEKLPDMHKNFYFTSFIWSTLLDSSQNIPLEIKLRKFVSDHIKNSIERRRQLNVQR